MRNLFNNDKFMKGYYITLIILCAGWAILQPATASAAVLCGGINGMSLGYRIARPTSEGWRL